MIRSLVLDAGPAERVGDPAAAVGGEHASGLLKASPVGLLPIRVTFGPGTVRAAVGG